MDWYEYAVTTRSGPGTLERPEGEGWELVDATSTATGGYTATASKAEHHAWWKRKRRQERAPLGQRPGPV